MAARCRAAEDGPSEVKWDGFRAIVSTVDGLRVQSRRRWNMTELVPELASLPEGLVLDGELVAWGDDGLPSFPRPCDRMLHRRPGIAVTYVVFDVLEVAGLSTMLQPYRERRVILEELELDKPTVVCDTFDDGQTLFRVVCDRGIEGVVAKKLTGRYVAGDRGSWVEVKNPTYWRLHQERELVRRRRPRAAI